MSFSARQVQALRRNLNPKQIRTRQLNGRELSYIEGWYAIAEANRIFGHDGWSRETVETKCVMSREIRGTFHSVYVAKVRITVRAGEYIVREGHGTGEGRGSSPGETHDVALKAAETDATKRALATFGKPFGLALYLKAPIARSHLVKDKPTPVTASVKLPAAANDNAAHSNGQGALPMLEAAVYAQRVIYTDVGLVPVAEIMRRQRKPLPHPIRRRDREHLRFVASQPCLICGRTPSDPHHLRFMQPRAHGLKVSDEFTVPLCRAHHRQLHHAQQEPEWWREMRIDAPVIAKNLWDETCGKQPPAINGTNADDVRTTDHS